MTVKKTENDKGEVVLEGEIKSDSFECHRESATRLLGKDIEIQGFRKGQAPANLIAEKLDEHAVLHEMANLTLQVELPKLFAEHKIQAVGRPNVAVTKLAAGNPLGFKITTAILPELTLPDYKAIAKKVASTKDKPAEVTDKEVEDAVLEIRKRAHATDIAQQTKDEKGSTPVKPPKDSDLPELTDELVKKLGSFAGVAEFKTKLKNDLALHKERQAAERKRMEIIENIVGEIDVTLPDIVVESELDRMMARFKADVSQAGMKFEDYLSQIEKDDETLRKEWRGDAEKQSKIQLVLNAIAKQESLKADEAKVNAEVGHVMSHNEKANKESVRIYIETLMTNDLVFQLLEKQGPETKKSE